MEAGDGEIRDAACDLGGRLRAVGPIPMRGPVQRAEKGARRDRIADEAADAAFVAVALGDDCGAHPRRQRVDLEMGGGAFDLVDEAEHVGHGEIVEAPGERTARPAGAIERGQQPIERPVLAEVEQLVLALEVVIQVGCGELRGARDVAHPGGGKADGAERPSGGAQDLDAAGVRAPLAVLRTAVRKVNHRSILAERSRAADPHRAVPIGSKPDRKELVTTRPSPPTSDNITLMRWRAYAFAIATVVAVVGVLQLLSVTSDGVASTLLLLDVVIVARWWGLGPALTTAAMGAAAYSYFFLPPAGFGIEKPEDWFGFIAFTITAFIAGELSARAERRAAEAQAGRLEIERLYQELKSAFDRASEAEAARRNEQLKAALLDALTHNLRTPLTAIKAAVTALRTDLEGEERAELPREGRDELLQVIDEESDRLNRFIAGLAVTDGPAPKERQRLRAVTVEQVVKAALSRAETVTKDHRVRVSLDPTLPRVAVDAASIVEVVYILLDNASKYAPPGTTIDVTAVSEAEHQLRITVADQGPGIPLDFAERVFEKFFRVPKRESHDPRRGGIGLGLPIARRLVEAQGGRIWIDTNVAQGTTVVILLPEADHEHDEHDDSRQVEGAGSGRRAADHARAADGVDEPGVSSPNSGGGRSGAVQLH